MATQVKFHNTTASAYGSATKTDGGLYFISDNGEIRKGDSHITGTRVYSASDTTGKTALEALDIKLGETSISTAGFTELPKKGDVLVVSHELTTGKYEYSAYVYATNGGTYNANGWQACDGNVDASKVILTQNITMAGNYDKIGNFTKTTSGKKINFIDNDTKGTAGVSVYELIKQMLSKTNEPTWKKNPPTVSINTPSAGTKEYGESASVTWTATFNKAYAQFDGGSEQYANNTPTYKFDGDTTGSSTNTKQKTWVAGVDAAPTTSVVVDYTAQTNDIKNNLGDVSTTINPQKISSGTTNTASSTATITVIRNWFYRVDKVGTGTIDSAFIRGGTKGGDCETASSSVEFTTGAGVKRIVVAIPQKNNSDSCTDAAKTLTNVYATHLGPTASIMSEYKKQSEGVQVNDASGHNPITYDVWIYSPASIGAAETHKFIIG